MARINHTGHNHPATAAGRAACRKVGHLAGTVFAPSAVPDAAQDDVLDTEMGKIRVGSIIVASIRGGGTERVTITTISEDIKNGYAGWSGDTRWGYTDQIVRIVKF